MFLGNILVFVGLVVAIVFVTRDMMIKNIRKIAIYLRWNNNVTGQILGYATSTPELINAVVAGSIGMINASIFNVLSSNIINVLFVVIATLIFKRTKSLNNKKFFISYILVFISILVPILLMVFNISENKISILFLVLLYLIFIYFSKKNSYFEEEKEELEIYEKEVNIAERKLKKKHLRLDRKNKVKRSVALLLISIILLYVLGNYLGVVLERLGEEFKISEIIIGIIMGIITSIPELMTFTSSYKRHRRYKNIKEDKGALEVVSNLVTSNISNLCIIQTVAIITYLLFGLG